MKRLLLAALAASILGTPAFAQGGGGVVSPSVPLTASCTTQSVAQLCFDAANTLAQRNGVNPQTACWANTFTDLSNYEYGCLKWNGNVLEVGTYNAGTGSARAFALTSVGTERWLVGTGGNFTAVIDNSYDIGASGANRPRSVFVAQGITAGGVITTANILTTGVFLVANLPSCTGRDGSRAAVSDATVAASGNFGAAVAGSGANHVPVYCDGTSWRIGQLVITPANDNFPMVFREDANRLWSNFG